MTTHFIAEYYVPCTCIVYYYNVYVFILYLLHLLYYIACACVKCVSVQLAISVVRLLSLSL